MSTKTIYSAEYRRLVQSLRDLRESAEISQSALSGTLGWPQQRLSAIEAGARRLDVMEFLQLVGALGLTPEAGIQLAVAATDKKSRVARSSNGHWSMPCNWLPEWCCGGRFGIDLLSSLAYQPRRP